MASLPLSYAARNLGRRPWRTALTLGGLALVIFACALMLSLARGIARRIVITGEPENLLVVSSKGTNAVFSAIEADEIVHLHTLGAGQEVIVSPELAHWVFVGAGEGEAYRRAPVTLRGVEPIAWSVHRDLRVIAGRLPEQPGEILAGRDAYVKLGVGPADLAPGRTVTFANRDWTICGTFAAGGSLVESELWLDADDLKSVLNRRNYSFAVVRFPSAAAVQAALPRFRQTGGLERYFKAWAEPAYYAEFTGSLAWIFWLIFFMVVATTVAGTLTGINTMYTAIANRRQELGALRVLGFSRGAIRRSLLVESLLLASLAGLIGGGVGRLLNGISFRMSYGGFSLVVDLPVLAAVLGLALVIGVVGVLLPARRGLNLPLVEALRRG